MFASTYTITAVPEPGFVLLMSMLLTAIVFGRRLGRPIRTQSLLPKIDLPRMVK